jgi:hypothetical protein
MNNVIGLVLLVIIKVMEMKTIAQHVPWIISKSLKLKVQQIALSVVKIFTIIHHMDNINVALISNVPKKIIY